MTGAVAMIMIDQTVVGVILPALQRNFGLSPSGLQWVVNGYTLALGAFLICGGWAGDRFGQFRAFMVGVIVFTLASLVCGLAPNSTILIAARIFQGIGAAFMQPNASAIVFSAFPADKRGKAMSTYIGVGMLFLALGPLLGGFLVEHLSWQTVFFINIPIGLATVIMALKNNPVTPVTTQSSIDFMGALLLISGTVFMTVAIQSAGDQSFSPLVIVTFFLLGLGAYTVLFQRRKSVEEPLLDFNLFKDRPFFGCCALLFCIQFAMLGQVVYGAIFVQNVLDFSPLQAGLAMLPVVVTITIMSQISGYLYSKISFRSLAIAGTAIIAIGFISQAVVLHLGNILWLIPGMLLIGLGLGTLASTVTTHALSRVSPLHRGKSSAMVQTLRQIGGVFGVTLIGSLVNLSEKMQITTLTNELQPLQGKKEQLQMLLFQAEQGQAAAAAEIANHWPNAISDLKTISSNGIAAGYYLGAAVVLIATVLSFKLFQESGGQPH